MKTTNKVLTALGAGLVAGAAAGILLAPRKGQETRKLISKKGKKLANQLTSEIKTGTRQITGQKPDLREKLAEMGRKLDVLS
jgi:gas vesicle protein